MYMKANYLLPHNYEVLFTVVPNDVGTNMMSITMRKGDLYRDIIKDCLYNDSNMEIKLYMSEEEDEFSIMCCNRRNITMFEVYFLLTKGQAVLEQNYRCLACPARVVGNII